MDTRHHSETRKEIDFHNFTINYINMKSAFKSKTLWFNFVAALLLAANSFFLDAEILQPEIAGFVVVAVNFILRFITDKAIQ